MLSSLGVPSGDSLAHEGLLLKRSGPNQTLSQHFLQHGILKGTEDQLLQKMCISLDITIAKFQEKKVSDKSRANLCKLGQGFPAIVL